MQYEWGGFAVAIAAGVAHTCVLLRSGRVACWGWNVFGQLGTGNTLMEKYPVEVKLNSGVDHIASFVA